ncbi:MAG TPA: 5-formyltetrahydrofolate cyclo-ligase [Candidatus Hydrogenedentes bacterium]|nr:5-formyltetrahydrofolate cyclo-ligase [Candidatus Hydrogenedentota bacterium]HOT50352.1 5-formyltetrahydrofolate cyclo-ligase [Candidatus Hydrogenedentota bacterium]HOV75177.1 5-formyltetrahydrofolate cyclo-ligase [Candidatus Hydrogenedentota bacterium]HPC18335.1 5-formyltetrahydrofolate cyclo-ligase [Candidatus Hydrogenedentota bacterium]HRT22097.1 5-formyltetrahydrofolate cyclo-ligase [Candidatus Hydrogenedentota bacterium]
MTSKDELRRIALAARRALSPEMAAAKSAAIAERVRALEAFQQAPCVLGYVASKDNEVDTRALMDGVLREGRPVLVPVAKPRGIMIWSALRDWNDLAESRFGILEPRAESMRPTTPPPGSVCLVPGIAFSEDGYRIGYGGGYFDRFLAGFDGVSIGLAFREQLYPRWIPEAHDIPVQMLVTD